jgi:hypothetical protein
MRVISKERFILSALGSLSDSRGSDRRMTQTRGHVAPRRYWGLHGPPRRVIAGMSRLAHRWP